MKTTLFWEGRCNRSRWLTVGVVCLLCCAVCLLIQRQSLRIITVRRMHKNDPLKKKPHTNSIHISKQYQYFTGCLCWIMSVLWALKAKHLHQQSAFKSKVANLFATIVMRFSCRKKIALWVCVYFVSRKSYQRHHLERVQPTNRNKQKRATRVRGRTTTTSPAVNRVPRKDELVKVRRG